MATTRPDPRGEIKLDPAALFLEEVFTDRRVGTIRRLTPVDGKGAPDPARKIVYVGETQVMSNVGALPIVFEIDASSLAEAATKFGPLAKDAVEQTMRELQELRRQAASSIVVPQGGLPPGGLWRRREDPAAVAPLAPFDEGAMSTPEGPAAFPAERDFRARKETLLNAPLPHDFAGPLEESITLGQAKKLIQCMAHEASFLLLAPPGVGKSEMVYQAAREAGLACRSLLGTQIAPEDVSGVPRIVGERSVFCPPRLLLPERPEPFCLFLDELPACAPDVQKAFYSLLLERRLGEHSLPAGTWVVAAGNRIQDRALVRSMSSALVNRVTMLHVRVDVDEWLAWARRNKVRPEILGFISYMPDALMRGVPPEPVPFSTPRSWAQLSRALDMAEAGGILTRETRRALSFGRLSAEDAAIFCALAEEAIGAMHPVAHYVEHPERLPRGDAARWFVLNCIRQHVRDGKLEGVKPRTVNRFLKSIPYEHQLTLLADLVDRWGALGADAAMLGLLKQVAKL